MAHTLSLEAIGTRWTIDVQDTLDESAWQTLVAAITSRISDFDTTYSRFRSDSLVTQMAERAGEYTLPSDALPLLDFYHRLYEITDGLLTPLIGDTLSDAGYDATYSLRRKDTLRTSPAWNETLEYTAETITVKKPALLDFGAAGKGYLIDIVGQLLASAGITEYVINAGGDILHRTARQEVATIALENPLDSSEAIGTVQLGNASLCASSGSRRTWGAYHHILNPATLESPTDVIATWVVARAAMHADGLATALFFVAPRALRDFSFDYAILKHDMSLEYSNSMPISFFGE